MIDVYKIITGKLCINSTANY